MTAATAERRYRGIDLSIPDPAAATVSPDIRGLRTGGPVFVRLGRNVAWLLGGRGVAGVLSLVYLGIAARALGPRGFGTFVLVLGYAGSIAGLAQFKSWQAVIRYGALHLPDGRRDRLARLFGFTASVDLASAVAGAAIAGAGVAIAGPTFGWSGAEAKAAALFGALILLATGDTASGMLRLFDRFALLSATQTVAALVRVVGAATVWASAGGLAEMLAVWGLAAIAECGLEWLFALRAFSSGIAIGPRHWREAVRDNPGIWRFMIQNSFAATLATLLQQAGTLSVGAAAGPAAAGGFRIATKLANALTQPAETATRALYPEFAVLAASRDHAVLRSVMLRASAIGLALALVLVAAIWAAGPLLLHWTSGRAFVSAQPVLVLLAVAAAVDLAGIALEPLLNAHGSAREIVIARVVGAIAYLAALALLLPLAGARGAALAAILGAVVLRMTLAAYARRLLD